MQVTAIKVALSTGTQNQKVDSVMAKPLKEQAFATPDKVAELVQKVCQLPIKLSWTQLPLLSPDIKIYVHQYS